MDKLKQILVYKFWIVLGLALVLPFVGWFMGRSGALAAIAAGTTRVDKAFSSVSDAKEVNQRWAEGLTKINEVQERGNVQAWEDLTAKQLALKTWPESVRPMVEDAGPTGEISAVGLEKYRIAYGKELERVHKIVRPIFTFGFSAFGPGVSGTGGDTPGVSGIGPRRSRIGRSGLRFGRGVTGTGGDSIGIGGRGFGGGIGRFGAGAPGFVPPVSVQPQGPTETGIVEFGINQLPPGDIWVDFYPKTQEVRDAQEDIWMYEALLLAIARVNASAESRADAAVQEIMGIDLLIGLGKLGLGGSFAAAPPPKSSRPSDDDGDDDEGGLGRGMRMGGDSATMRRGGGGNFDVLQYFNAAGEQRYVEETTQFRSRAFNLELRMDHRRVPDLLVELANSPWPVEILRVSQQSGSGSSRPGRSTSRGNGETPGKGGDTAGTGGSRRSYRPRSRPASRANDDDDEDEDDDLYSRNSRGRNSRGRGAAMGSARGNLGSEGDPFLWDVGITGTLRLYKRRGEASRADDAGQPATNAGGAGKARRRPGEDT